ncbi:hypothetical protein HanHA300_Chr12g0453011 [Helianthus annuus]|nr:hypothetical protein HanHA300_Chr12g0453011 [Helianthus annuus]KAJ0506142.1 hypothetical protein HanHA89_Chr12g0478601 [Helianthus annuus]KAJ0675813.1 hypothetical protein HanLR1_Chr12g0455501 [Helianthus annuus]KAJ0679071.1 hypothetical protein HanOQP8_Chr12g0455171 [Helianthus annuus]
MSYVFMFGIALFRYLFHIHVLRVYRFVSLFLCFAWIHHRLTGSPTAMGRARYHHHYFIVLLFASRGLNHIIYFTDYVSLYLVTLLVNVD